MSAAHSDIYASAPLQGLLRAEAAGLLPDIQRCRGEHGLLVTAAGRDAPPAAPMLSCWTRVQVTERFFIGDLRARTDESLPFVADAFEVVILRHALEATTLPQRLLDEAARVLAPGGLLVVSGIHPLSLWTPWLAWRLQRRMPHLYAPLQLRTWLGRASVQVEGTRRIGRPWPGTAGEGPGNALVGGGYLLLARKQRHASAPVRLVPRAVRSAAATPGFAPEARRNRA